MLSMLNNYIGILGFVITLSTFFIALRVKKRLDRYSNRQQFLQERHIYTETLSNYYEKINKENIPYRDILEALRNIQKLTEEMLAYKIWKSEQLKVLIEFKTFTEKCLTEINSYSKRSWTKWRCPYCAMYVVGRQTCVCGYSCRSFKDEDKIKMHSYMSVEETAISHTFKNEYCLQLGKVVALIKRPSNYEI